MHRSQRGDWSSDVCSSDLIAAIEGKPSEIGTAEAGRASVAAFRAMLQSSAERRWISLQP
jgi:hypothetical protein